MNKKLSVLLSASASIAVCASLIAGSTFALFMSEAKTNIAVTSGKVKVDATLGDLQTYSYQLQEDGSYAEEPMEDDLFYGGSAALDESNHTLTLTDMVPGDRAAFRISVSNTSTVSIQYRAVISCEKDTGLFAGLNVTVGEDVFNGYTAYTDWAPLEAGTDPASVSVEVALPYLTTDQNEYQGKSCTIGYKVEAVQGNAKVENISEGGTGIFGAHDLQLLAEEVNAGTAEGLFELGGDIDLAETEWTPIGSATDSSARFAGTFDGKGHTISHLNAPLFGGAGKNSSFGETEIKNFTLNVSGRGKLADFVTANTLIQNVTVTGETSFDVQNNSSNEEFYCAAFVGSAYQVRFTDCVNQASVTSKTVSAGFLGKALGDCSFTNCVNEGTIKTERPDGGAKASGFIGVVGCYHATFTDCENRGDCTAIGSAELYAAGFACWVADGSSDVVDLTNCKNYGAISGIRTGSGGSTVAVGGILATVWNASANLTNVENHGTVSADNRADAHNAHIGGIIGMCNPNANVEINGLVSDGALIGKISNPANSSGVCNIGGVIGQTNTVTRLYIHGQILLTEKMTITVEQKSATPNRDALIGNHGSNKIEVDVSELTNHSSETTAYSA